MTIRSSSAGVPGRIAPAAAARAVRIAAASAAVLAPWNGRWPRHHLVQQHADAEEIAARIEPLAAGLLGRHVRRRADDVALTADGRHGLDAPVAEALAGSCLARPKSITLASPRGVTMTLPGLMSRCRMPCACASVRASTMLDGDRQDLLELER